MRRAAGSIIGQVRTNATFLCLLHLAPMCIKPLWVSFPLILILPEIRGRISMWRGRMSQGIGIQHTYTVLHTVQAGFYSNTAVCWIFVQSVLTSILDQVGTEDIFFSCYTYMYNSVSGSYFSLPKKSQSCDTAGVFYKFCMMMTFRLDYPKLGLSWWGPLKPNNRRKISSISSLKQCNFLQ